MNVNTNIRPNCIISQLVPMDQQGEVGGRSIVEEQEAVQALNNARINIIALRNLINNNIINGGMEIREVGEDQDLTNQFLVQLEDDFSRLMHPITNPHLPRLQNHALQGILEQARDCGLYRIVRDILISQNNDNLQIVRDFLNPVDAANYRGTQNNIINLTNTLTNRPQNHLQGILNDVTTSIRNRSIIELNRETALFPPSSHNLGTMLVYAFTLPIDLNE